MISAIDIRSSDDDDLIKALGIEDKYRELAGTLT